MGQLWRRIRYLLARRRHDRELAEEMAAHREMLERDGHARFGHPLLLREDAREAWGWMWLDRLQQDLAYGARILRRSPGFALSAVAILALGIGVNLAAFHLLNFMVFKPLPVRDPDSIVSFTRASPRFSASSVPYPAVEFYRRHNTPLSAVMVTAPAVLTLGRDFTNPISAEFVTANFFTELGAIPAYGRGLDPGTDGQPGAEPVAVLSYGFWQSRFGADPRIVGTTIQLNRKPVTVVGVAPYDFMGLNADLTAVWLPITSHPYLVQGSNLLTEFRMNSVRMFGRLKPGVTMPQAEEALKPLVAEMHRQHPDFFQKEEYLAVRPGGYLADLNNAPLPILGLFAALVLLILVVACANLGSLMLARAVTREREIAIRVSIGAGRGRIIRQLLTESVLLAALGATAGMGASALMIQFFILVLGLPGLYRFAVDMRVFLVALGLTFLATLSFGLAPALQAARPGHRAHRARRVLIAAQVAASCVLLIVSGLMVRSLRIALGTHPGFEYERAVTLDPVLGLHGYKGEAAAGYLEELRNRILRIPGVESAALCTMPPFAGRVSVTSSQEPRPWSAHGNDVDPNYFRTMEIPLLRGRNFVPGEKRDKAIVSETLARNLWPGEDPLGKTLDDETVVGVVGRARTVAMAQTDFEVYYPLQSRDAQSAVLLVKTAGPPEAHVDSLRSAAQALDPKVMPAVTLMKESYRRRMQSAGRGAIVVSVMGLLAALLAATGVYGLVAYAVSQRQKEIGIRVALGAPRAHILTLVLRQFYKPVGAGIAIGMAFAAGLSAALRSLLFGMSHLDPLSYVLAVIFFLMLAGAAALVPARKALRVDPMVALRHE